MNNTNYDIDQRLIPIVRLLQNSNYEEAARQAESLSAIPKLKTTAIAVMGLADAIDNNAESALEKLKNLEDPDEIQTAVGQHCAGSAWFKLGYPAHAISFLSRAFYKMPEHPMINAHYGACLLAIGKLHEAEEKLTKAAELMPNQGGNWLNLARVFLMKGDAQKALEALDKAAPLPNTNANRYLMAKVEALTSLDRHAEAEQLLLKTGESGDEESVAALAHMLSSKGRHDEAWSLLKDAVENSENIVLMEILVELANIRGRFNEAMYWLRKTIDKQPDNASLWAKMAMLNTHRFFDQKTGRGAAEKALELTDGLRSQQRAQALVAYAYILSDEGKTDDAEIHYHKALEMAPASVAAISGLGNLLMQLGHIDEAVELFEKLQEIAPVHAWNLLINARKLPDDPSVLEQIEKAAHQPTLAGPVQSHLLFTLASAWEKKKNYKKAWSYAVKANEASVKHLNYNPDTYRAKTDKIIARFSAEFMNSRKGYGADSELPVFILGMPRSGTTLVEQILGSHSKVFGAGELSQIPVLIHKLIAWEKKLGSGITYPECVADIALAESKQYAEQLIKDLKHYSPESERIIDKLPHNFENIGLIKLIFPNAKILHLKREPRDVAMSNFFTDYKAKFGGMGFAYDLTWIGQQLVDHQRLMNHWHSVFPGHILEVDYDLLVEDVEYWAHKIIDFMGLQWEKSVLDFQKLERSVKTASLWQVRQPVYKTSKAKWKRYEEYLEPLEKALAEKTAPVVPMPLPLHEPDLFFNAMHNLNNNHIAEAEKLFDKLLQNIPDHAAALQFQGIVYLKQGKTEEACKHMRKSVRICSTNLSWFKNLLQVEKALGNIEQIEKITNLINKSGKQDIR